jgi:hypothetical protein
LVIPLGYAPRQGGECRATTLYALGDIDGNGGADLVLTIKEPGGGSAAMAAVSTYEGFWLQAPFWRDAGTGWAGITPLVGDVNGDRKADYVFLANAGAESTRAYVARSAGGLFGAPQLWWNGVGYNYDQSSSRGQPGVSVGHEASDERGAVR